MKARKREINTLKRKRKEVKQEEKTKLINRNDKKNEETEMIIKGVTT